MADDLCGRSYRAGSGRYYDCERAAGHTGSHLPWPDSDQEPTVADDLRAEAREQIARALGVSEGFADRRVLALRAVQEALAAADAVKRVEAFLRQQEHPAVPPSTATAADVLAAVRRALAGEDR